MRSSYKQSVSRFMGASTAAVMHSHLDTPNAVSDGADTGVKPSPNCSFFALQLTKWRCKQSFRLNILRQFGHLLLSAPCTVLMCRFRLSIVENDKAQMLQLISTFTCRATDSGTGMFESTNILAISE